MPRLSKPCIIPDTFLTRPMEVSLGIALNSANNHRIHELARSLLCRAKTTRSTPPPHFEKRNCCTRCFREDRFWTIHSEDLCWTPALRAQAAREKAEKEYVLVTFQRI